jgi:hypothetical protein
MLSDVKSSQEKEYVMSVHRMLAAAAADVLAQPAAAGSYTLTPGRFWSLVATLLGLAGVVVGSRALARSASRGTGTGAGAGRAVVALAAGLSGTVIGAVVVAAAKGGPGTGYGIVGGFVALVVGAIGIVLGGLALARSRRAAPRGVTSGGRA